MVGDQPESARVYPSPAGDARRSRMSADGGSGSSGTSEPGIAWRRPLGRGVRGLFCGRGGAAGRAAGSCRWPLRGFPDRRQDPVAQGRRRRGLGEQAQLGCDLAEHCDLPAAGLAGGQVRLELRPLGRIERVESVGTGGLVDRRSRMTIPEDFAQAPECVPDPGLDGAQGQVQQVRDLALGQAVEVGQRQRLALDRSSGAAWPGAPDRHRAAAPRCPRPGRPRGRWSGRRTGGRGSPRSTPNAPGRPPGDGPWWRSRRGRCPWPGCSGRTAATPRRTPPASLLRHALESAAPGARPHGRDER